MATTRARARQGGGIRLGSVRGRRAAQAALGLVLIAGGLPLLVLPGPGLGLIAAGGGLLAAARRGRTEATPDRPRTVAMWRKLIHRRGEERR